MSRGSRTISAWSVVGAYALLLTLFLWPAADLLTSSWPLQFGSLQWRYGFLGLMANFLHTPLLSLALAMALAFGLAHTLALRLMGILAMVVSLLLVVAMILFGLDVIQLHGGQPPETVGLFRLSAVIAELKHFTAAVVFLLLGLGAWITAGRMAREVAPKKRGGLTAEVLKAQQKE